MFSPQIKILKSDLKWTNYMYVASSARSRMKTEELNRKVEKKEVEIVNPDLLFETEATV